MAKQTDKKPATEKVASERRSGRKPAPLRLPTMEIENSSKLSPQDTKIIRRAAEHYEDVRNRRQDLTREEVKAKDSLAGLMRHHGIETFYYEDDGGHPMEAVITKLENVKVRTRKEGEEEEEAEED